MRTARRSGRAGAGGPEASVPGGSPGGGPRPAASHRAAQRERVFGLQPRQRAGHGGVEARAAERLEHVVERVHLERAHRMLVERGHEHHAARHVLAQRFEHAEAVPARHLHVEEQEVGPEPPHQLHRLLARRRLAHHLHRRLVGAAA